MRRSDNYCYYITHYNIQIRELVIEEKRLETVRDDLIHHIEDFKNATKEHYRDISIGGYHNRCEHQNRLQNRLLTIKRNLRDTIERRKLFTEYLDNCPLG